MSRLDTSAHVDACDARADSLDPPVGVTTFRGAVHGAAWASIAQIRAARIAHPHAPWQMRDAEPAFEILRACLAQRHAYEPRFGGQS